MSQARSPVVVAPADIAPIMHCMHIADAMLVMMTVVVLGQQPRRAGASPGSAAAAVVNGTAATSPIDPTSVATTSVATMLLELPRFLMQRSTLGEAKRCAEGLIRARFASRGYCGSTARPPFRSPSALSLESELDAGGVRAARAQAAWRTRWSRSATFVARAAASA